MGYHGPGPSSVLMVGTVQYHAAFTITHNIFLMKWEETKMDEPLIQPVCRQPTSPSRNAVRKVQGKEEK